MVLALLAAPAAGTRADAPVRVVASAEPFETAGTLRVDVESTDGRPHAVRVSVRAARGVNALGEPVLSVPARGSASARVSLIRIGSSRRETVPVTVVATAESGGAETTAFVRLTEHQPALPRLRAPLAVASALLLAAAVAAEFWARWRTG